MNGDLVQTLRHTVAERTARVGVCGLGYVGLPLAIAVARAGFRVVGFDIDQYKVRQLNSGVSYIGGVASSALRGAVSEGLFTATLNMAELAGCDIILICVPTPLTRHREPDLGFVERTVENVAKYLRPGQVVILESTTYPGTTTGVVKPILERTGLRSGVDFYLGFSPEREDPGNQEFSTHTIPKIVSGEGPDAKLLITLFYSLVIKQVVTVSSNEIAEAVKITENVFRAVNIALVNELKVVYDAMGIDIWEVIEAAKTKPFGFMPFYPGPGLGGHCIPIDPFYLTWKSREYEVPTRFIELAGEINLSMPRFVIGKLEEALSRRESKALSVSRILLFGLAYKKNVPDVRESPTFKLMELLEKRGARVEYHDPHVGVIPETREHSKYAGKTSISVNGGTLQDFDAVVIATDHDNVDYSQLSNAKLIVDTRNACSRRGYNWPHVVKA